MESAGPSLVKLVADARSGQILGGHVAAPAAGEMISEAVAAMAAHATVTVRDLAETIRAFPNFAEGVKAAARARHRLSPAWRTLPRDVRGPPHGPHARTRAR
jgi:hypothetical protein